MKNTPFLLDPDERIRHWRKLRLDLESLSKEEQLLAVARFWATWPELQHYIDIDDPTQWETPWEIIYHGQMCRSTKAYLMEQTLLQSNCGWTKDQMKLLLIKDDYLSAMFIILVVDDKYVLNYDVTAVNEFDRIRNSFVILNRFVIGGKVHLVDN